MHIFKSPGDPSVISYLLSKFQCLKTGMRRQALLKKKKCKNQQSQPRVEVGRSDEHGINLKGHNLKG